MMMVKIMVMVDMVGIVVKVLLMRWKWRLGKIHGDRDDGAGDCVVEDVLPSR